jgi:hypothetical protein
MIRLLALGNLGGSQYPSSSSSPKHPSTLKRLQKRICAGLCSPCLEMVAQGDILGPSKLPVTHLMHQRHSQERNEMATHGDASPKQIGGKFKVIRPLPILKAAQLQQAAMVELTHHLWTFVQLLPKHKIGREALSISQMQCNIGMQIFLGLR